MRWKDITGHRFGMLVALAPARTPPRHANGTWDWYFQCDCGNFCVKARSVVRRVQYANCGCRTSHLRSIAGVKGGKTTTHGGSKSLEYQVWSAMKRRCSNPNTVEYKNYGGRGIKVCPEWAASFEAFWTDMGPTYQRGLQIDRIDTNGGYSPENCHWTTSKLNNRNRRDNRFLETPWGQITMAEAAERSGLTSVTICQRLSRGWSSMEAVTTPPQTHKGV